VDVAGGHQPFASEDGSVWAAQNGELYNHVELRRGLEAERHRFVSRCDTEVLPHLYEREGERYPELLRGKFATVVWDGRRRRAVLARDRLGVKPLYWARRGDLVVFGSELKSVLASGLIEPELDYEAIDAYLTFGFLPGPRTPLREVWKLLPGHRLIVDPDGVRSEAYWRYPTPQPDHGPSEQEHAERLLELLEESVRLRLMSDVPLGAMLSGGLDSSLIVALMARNMPEPVKTFSVGFREAAEGNELADARQVAAHFGTDHHELELSLHDQQLDLPTLLWHLDEPLADLSALGFHHLSHLAAQHVTVALSGQGADELLGGYTKHLAASLAQRAPAPVRAAARLAAQRRGRLGRAARTLTAGDGAERLLAMSGHVDPALRAQLYRGPMRQTSGAEAANAVTRLLRGYRGGPLATTLFVDAQLALVDDMLHYFDRTSMAHSLEVRVPFLDHHLVEHCATIPDELKVRGLTRKHLLREIARDLVPEEVLRKKKVGFFIGAMGTWFRAQADGAIRDYLLDGTPHVGELLDRDAVRAIVAHHARGERRHERLVVSILLLEVWLREYLPRATAAPAPERVEVAG
jgi:asparagine synthase (glutamine-hydrolysing)